MRQAAALLSLDHIRDAAAPACRGCGAPACEDFCDLGLVPVDATPVPVGSASEVAFRPHRLLACSECGLVQPPEGEGACGFGAAAARRLRGRGLAPVMVGTGDALARAADSHDVAAGLRILLAPGGTAVLDLPWLLPALEALRPDLLGDGRACLFDLASAEVLLAEHGLVVFDATGAASLRIRVRHFEDARPVAPAVQALREREAGVARARAGFAARLAEAKCALLDFLIGLRRAGRAVAALGDAASSDLLLRVCGIGPELLPAIATPGAAAPGLCLPGCRIRLVPLDHLAASRPDFVLALPQADMAAAIAAIRACGARPVLPLPRLQIL